MTPLIMDLEPDALLRMALSESLRDCGYRVIEGVKAYDVCVVIGNSQFLHHGRPTSANDSRS